MGIVHDIRRILARIPRLQHRHCVLCDHRVGRFLPYRGSRGALSLMRALQVVGSDIDNFECPRCGAHDRERHALMYLEASGLRSSIPDMRILHFAPERQLAKYIAGLNPSQYVKADLFPTGAGIERVDIEDMPFPDGSFDLLIANHVLEHVDDDAKATGEIHRVLAPGGIAILQTPYSQMLKRTWSDPGIVGDAARLHAYGQEDHVRLFGRDIFERFAASGLRPLIATHAGLLPDRDAAILGVNAQEPFFLFHRDPKPPGLGGLGSGHAR